MTWELQGAWERGQAGEARVPGRMCFVVFSASMVLSLGRALESTEALWSHPQIGTRVSGGDVGHLL